MMSIFSIKFSFTIGDVVHHKTAIVRASSPELAKDKLVTSLLRINGSSYQSFSIDKISVSSYNYVFV